MVIEITNFEKITQSAEALREFIVSFRWQCEICARKENCKVGNMFECKNGILEWLGQPNEEKDRVTLAE